MTVRWRYDSVFSKRFNLSRIFTLKLYFKLKNALIAIIKQAKILFLKHFIKLHATLEKSIIHDTLAEKPNAQY